MPDVKNVKKRPVVIQGVYLDEGMTAVDLYDAAEWCGGTVASNDSGPTGVVLETLDGNTATVHPGWWILKGIAGEFYPCAPDVFASTYDILEVNYGPLSDRLFVRGVFAVSDLPDWVIEDGGLSELGEQAMFGSEFTEGVPNFSALDEPMAWVLTADQDAGFEPETEPEQKPVEALGDYIVRRDKERQEEAALFGDEGKARLPEDAVVAAILEGNPSPNEVQMRLNGAVIAIRDAVARARQ